MYPYEKEVNNSFNNIIAPYMGLLNIIKEGKRKKQLKMQELADSMTQDEIDLYNEGVRIHNEKLAEERRIRECVTNHMCPNGCEGLLERGSKDKKNNYRRLYVCHVCGSKWFRED